LISTATVAAAEAQPFKFVVNVYVPLIAVVVFGMTGFCKALLNPAGPLHEYVVPAGPAGVERFNVVPVHSGPFAAAVGLEGAAGFISVNGPMMLEAHPMIVTKIFVYVPAAKFAIVMLPVPFDVSVTVTGVPAFFVYCTL
jgi:hypothetical protein